jgi:hypothetical protein
MTSYEDDGNADAGISQLPLKIQSVDSRKPHVKNKTTWPIRALGGQELLRRPEGLGPQAYRFQQALNGGTNQIVVINNEYRGITCSRH